MARTVVADAGPLIACASVDLLFVRKALFSPLTMTKSVRAECSAKPGCDTHSAALALGIEPGSVGPAFVVRKVAF